MLHEADDLEHLLLAEALCEHSSPFAQVAPYYRQQLASLFGEIHAVLAAVVVVYLAPDVAKLLELARGTGYTAFIYSDVLSHEILARAGDMVERCEQHIHWALEPGVGKLGVHVAPALPIQLKHES
jgi:hypothetical protein